MSVYSEGDGEATFVFMSGGGTCSPILDFKSLYTLLSDQYKVVVVERFGYGFSDTAHRERDIVSILEDTRAALKEADIDPPFILCPHSMAGIEALYWAQQYPHEVRAIIGLDMATPAAYEKMEISKSMLRCFQFAARTGMTRLIPGLSDGTAVKYGTLTEQEKEIYRSIFYSRTMTEPMVKEMFSVKDNAKQVAEGGDIATPILLFCSNGSGTGFTETEWREGQISFAQQAAAGIGNGEIIYLDCGHYIHNFEFEKIAHEIKSWLK
ncbi:MAG TPA: alpha/beta hydrolase [Clostridiaceae bacterium]|nr:alpha/beta hydrolase [Clostridiaceae bacterium]